MPRPPKWQTVLETSIQEATLATSLYNDPSEPRCLESFIVHMHLAWLYLLHAIFERDSVDYRYRQKENPRRLERIDGEVKRWELSKCVSHHFPNNESVRANIAFFIALRNKIEHRHLKADENISLAVSGRAHALLLNYEKEIVSQFGSQWSLATVLRTPIFIGTFTKDGAQTLRDLQQSIPPDLQKFLTTFDAELGEEVLSSPEFDIRLKVILNTAQRGKDALALEFVRLEDLTEEELAAYEVLQRKGAVLIREKHQPVSNLDKLKPGQVVEQVRDRIPFEFESHHHIWAWQTQEVRPSGSSSNPHRTKQEYCVYDSAHNDYLYTEKWVELIVASCQTEEGFRNFVGRDPVSKTLDPDLEEQVAD